MAKQLTIDEVRRIPFDGITDIQHEFLMTYLMTRNVSEACRTVHISNQTGHKWLKKKEMKAIIEEYGRRITQKFELTLDKCLNELKKIAFFDHKDYLEKFSFKDGEACVEISDLENIDTTAIKSMTIKTNSKGIPYVEIKPYDKMEALKELIVHLKGYQGPKELHLHVTEDKVKKLSAQEVSANYQMLVNGEE
jgi:hypothetical protein